MNKTILFLDFDGVLHAPNCRASRLFEHLARLEAVLAAFPEVGIVVSSSWRVRRTLEQLRVFAIEMRARERLNALVDLPARAAHR